MPSTLRSGESPRVCSAPQRLGLTQRAACSGGRAGAKSQGAEGTCSRGGGWSGACLTPQFTFPFLRGCLVLFYRRQPGSGSAWLGVAEHSCSAGRTRADGRLLPLCQVAERLALFRPPCPCPPSPPSSSRHTCRHTCYLVARTAGRIPGLWECLEGKKTAEAAIPLCRRDFPVFLGKSDTESPYSCGLPLPPGSPSSTPCLCPAGHVAGW